MQKIGGPKCRIFLHFGLFDKNRPPEKFDSSNILCYAIFDPRAPWGPQEIDLSLEGPDQNFEHII